MIRVAITFFITSHAAHASRQPARQAASDVVNWVNSWSG